VRTIEAKLPIKLPCFLFAGYTPGMKTAVSIPDPIFKKAEQLARRMKKSRSELFSNALAEYVDRHAPDQITEAMNEVCREVGSEADPFVTAAARRAMERIEW
jgi:predicted transcriptional regulator